MKKLLLMLGLACCLMPTWADEKKEDGKKKEDDKELKIHDPIGLAGMVAVPMTSADGAPLVVMTGGANFPNAVPGARTPAERGAKVFSADVTVMPAPGTCSNPEKARPVKVGSMPYSVGYAAFAPVDKGMIVAGGCNETGHLASVVRVSVDNAQVTTAELPALPVSVAYPAFAVEAGKLYVMGGQEKADSTTCLNRSFVMDLTQPAAGWQELAPMPGEGRMLAGAGVVQGKIYVAGGCSLHPDANGQAERTYLKSVVCYDPATNAWTADLPEMPETLVGAANPLPVVSDTLYVICGDPGNFYRASLAGKAPEEHPGQNRTIYGFNPATGEWNNVGFKKVGVATAPAVLRGNAITVVSGETHPGVRTPVVSTMNCPDSHPTLGFLADLTPWLALGIAVLAIMTALKTGLKKTVIALNAPVTKPGKWAWIAVAVLWVVVMLNYFDRQLLAVLNKSLTEGFYAIEMTQEQYGLVTAAFLIVYAALSPVGGYLADRFSRSFIIMCSLVIWSVVTWMTGKAGSFEELIFWRGLMGVSEAFYIPAALALITDYHRGGTRSLATGLHMSGIYAGQVLAGYGAMMAGDPCQLGWRLTFEVFGFIGVAYGLIVLFFLRDPKGEEAPAAAVEAAVKEEAAPAAPQFTMGQMLKSIFTGRGMYMLLLMISFAGFANWFLLSWYPRLLQDMFNITEAEAGPQATLWVNITKYISVLACAVIADRWYLRNKNARAYVPGIAFCLAGPCVLVAMLFGLEIGLIAVLALVSMQGVAQGAMDATLMPVLRSTIDERFAATGYGLLNLTSVGAGALVAWLGGKLMDSGVPLSAVLSVAGILMALTGVILFCLPKKSNA